MDYQGVDAVLLGLQVLNLALLGVAIWLMIMAIRRLNRLHKPFVAHLAWGLSIIVLPFIGAAIFLLMHPARPGDDIQEAR